MRKRRFAREPEVDPFYDMLFNMLIAFVFCFIVALLAMNPKALKAGDIPSKAEYIVNVSWPDMDPNDVDAWAQDPAGNLVWFRQREAGLMHLDRDDRGLTNDVIVINGKQVVNPLNQEVLTIRGIEAGEFTINVQLLRIEEPAAGAGHGVGHQGQPEGRGRVLRPDHARPQGRRGHRLRASRCCRMARWPTSTPFRSPSCSAYDDRDRAFLRRARRAVCAGAALVALAGLAQRLARWSSAWPASTSTPTTPCTAVWGWPSADALPERFVLLAAVIEEPSAKTAGCALRLGQRGRERQAGGAAACLSSCPTRRIFMRCSTRA